MNTEITDGILTFDELLEDDYYNAEFEKRVQQRLDIQNSHSDVKGGTNPMDEQEVQKPNPGEQTNGGAQAAQEPQTPPNTTDDPTVKTTDTAQQGKEETAQEPAKEMTAEQYDLYNETLRRLSKTARASLPNRYNAFEDTEVRTLVYKQVMQGEKPNIKELAASVVTRLTPKEEPTPPSTETTKATAEADEVQNLKAEIALLKAGILPERIEAAKTLFIAEGGNLDKVTEFVAKYPEWGAQSGSVVLGKAQPLADKTAPTPGNPPVQNEFERKVKEARKKAGLE